MISYASVDRIENNFAICEIENIPKEKSLITDFNKRTFFYDIPLTLITFNIQEGDILIIKHSRRKVEKILSKDNDEKERRIEFIQKLY